MIRHTWNQLSEATKKKQLDEAFTSARYGGKVHKPKKKKFDKNDFKILSKKEQEFLSMGATMFSGAGPVIEPKNLHFLTPQGLSITLKKMEKEKRNLDSEGKKLLQSVTKKLSSLTEQYGFNPNKDEDEEEKKRMLARMMAKRDGTTRPLETGQPGAVSMDIGYDKLASMAKKPEGEQDSRAKVGKPATMDNQPGLPPKPAPQGMPPQGMPKGMPQGMPQGIKQLMQNPEIMKKVKDGMQNPEIMKKVRDMMGGQGMPPQGGQGMPPQGGQGMPQGIKQLMQNPEIMKKVKDGMQNPEIMKKVQSIMADPSQMEKIKGAMKDPSQMQDALGKLKGAPGESKGPRDMNPSKDFADRMGIDPHTRHAAQRYSDEPSAPKRQGPTQKSPQTTEGSQEWIRKYSVQIKSFLKDILDKEKENFQGGSLGEQVNAVGDGMSPIEGEGNVTGRDSFLFRRKNKKGDCGCKNCKCKKNNRQ